MADPLRTGFAGFDARSHLYANIRTDAMLMNAVAATPIKKFSPLIVNASGRLEHAAVVGTNEVQTLNEAASPATGGTFTISYGGQTTAALAWNATPAQISAALQALSSIGSGNVSVSAAVASVDLGAISVTFQNALSGTNVAAMTVSNTGLTGGSSPAVVVATTTAGVLGYVTSTKLVGFSDEWEAGPLDGIYDRNFPQAPKELDYPFGGKNTTGTDLRQIQYFPVRGGNLFTGCIDPTVAVAETLLASGGTACSIGYDPGNKSCYLRTADTTNSLVKIIGIQPGQIGVYGGRVDFVMLDSKSTDES